MENKDKSLIIIISAPSGSGKTTIVNELLRSMKNLELSISYTTRKQRGQEQENQEYFFISEEEFKKKIQNNEFIEWEENFGFYYGTSKIYIQEILNRNKDVILSIDVKGARKIRKIFPYSISIFIQVPSIEELKNRLKKRGTDDKDNLKLRIKEYERELKAAYEYEYIVENKYLDKAVKEVELIIKKERKKGRKI